MGRDGCLTRIPNCREFVNSFCPTGILVARRFGGAGFFLKPPFPPFGYLEIPLTQDVSAANGRRARRHGLHVFVFVEVGAIARSDPMYDEAGEQNCRVSSESGHGSQGLEANNSPSVWQQTIQSHMASSSKTVKMIMFLPCVNTPSSTAI